MLGTIGALVSTSSPAPRGTVLQPVIAVTNATAANIPNIIRLIIVALTLLQLFDAAYGVFHPLPAKDVAL